MSGTGCQSETPSRRMIRPESNALGQRESAGRAAVERDQAERRDPRAVGVRILREQADEHRATIPREGQVVPVQPTPFLGGRRAHPRLRLARAIDPSEPVVVQEQQDVLGRVPGEDHAAAAQEVARIALPALVDAGDFLDDEGLGLADLHHAHVHRLVGLRRRGRSRRGRCTRGSGRSGSSGRTPARTGRSTSPGAGRAWCRPGCRWPSGPPATS